MKRILEQRYLFDGSVGATTHHVAHSDHHDPLPHHSDAAAPGSEHSQAGASDAEHNQAGAQAPALPDAPASDRAAPTTVLFVDPRVTNWQSLVDGVKPGVEVVLLDPARDGIAQVTQALRGLDGVRNLEFLTDGMAGSITLGGSTLDSASMTARASEIVGWSGALSGRADVVFWGCDVASGQAGARFVADMHTLTGAAIGASSDATGAAAQGGNWTLEVATGALHRDVVPFTPAATDHYAGVLDTPLPTVTLAISDATSTHLPSGTILLGDTINVGMTFNNQATNAAGFGPYVELFVPSSLTLSSASIGGSALATRSASVVGGNFVNPMTGLGETALAGVSSGTAYFLVLPYGSFTPGEPAVSIAAQLDLAPSLTVTEKVALAGQTLPIVARAGFQFGALATGGTPILQASPVSASETVELIASWVTASTAPGEGETATGPDFPVTYTVHLDPAPAILASGVPVTNLTTSLLLPNAVIATGAAVASASGTDTGTASITLAPALDGAAQTLTIDYARLSHPETVTFTAYVPQTYQYTDLNTSTGGGNPILDPNTGNPVSVSFDQAYGLAADAWQGGTVSGSGEVTEATFIAKSVAVQLGGTSGAFPSQDVNYTLRFQVSDYFGASGLTLGATLGDGLTFDPTVGHTPVLTVAAGSNGGVSVAGAPFSITPASETSAIVNNETVNASGSGANISYLFDVGTGQTAVAFDAGSLLPGTLGAGTTGSVSFSAKVLDAYASGTDQFSGAGGFLREGDAINANGVGSMASLFDYASGIYGATVGAMSDTTELATNVLPKGTMSLSIVAVTQGGTTYTSGSHLTAIAPGDIVVYQLSYTLAQPGDFAGLSLTAYLPEPLFSVLSPTVPDATDFISGATSTTAFTLSGASASTLASGRYNFTTSYAGAPGIAVGSATASEPSNSLTFNFASTGPGHPSFLNATTGVGAPQTVTVDFAVTASFLPFVDGLHLTAQGDSNNIPAQAARFTLQQAQEVTLQEPMLLTVKQGVVSIVDDNGTDIASAPRIVWTAGDTGAVMTGTAAAAVFAKAGTGGTTVFANGALVPSVQTLGVDNLDVAGAQAGDTIRLVDTVQNTGAFPAYDVIVKDALSQAFTTNDVSHLNFTRGDGTALVALDPITGNPLTNTQAIAKLFSSQGVLLTVGGDHTGAVLAAAGTATDIVYITYDVKLPATTPTAASLTGYFTLVAWTSQDLYVSTGSGYTLTMPGSGADGNFATVPAIGGTTENLTDSATAATLVPAITDVITGATDASDGGASIPLNTFDTHHATVVPGETISLMTTVTLPQGVNNNLVVSDVLPAGLTAVPGSVIAAYYDAQGNVVAQPSLQASFAGNTLTLTQADWTVPENAGGDRPAMIVITYQAIVPGTGSAVDASAWTPANLASQDIGVTDHFTDPLEGIGYATTTATSIATTMGAVAASGQPNTVTITNPLVTAAISDDISGHIHSGEVISYTLTLTNTSNLSAYDVGSHITLPSGLSYIGGSLTQSSGPVAATFTPGNFGVNGSVGAGDVIEGMTLAAGQTSTFTFQATVNDNLAAGSAEATVATPSWASLPASVVLDPGHANANAQIYTGNPVSVSDSVAAIVPGLSIIGESNNTSGAGTSFNPVSTIIATDGEIVRMRAVLQVPEGQNNAADIQFTLPGGLTYQNDNSTAVLLLSPNGDLITTAGLAGSNPGVLQRATGGSLVDTASLNLGIGSGDPVTTLLDTSAITVAGQTVTFALGQLTNNDGSPLANYVVIEFNAVVGDNTADGSVLTTSMHGDANGVSTGVVTSTVDVTAPVVSLTKTIESIVYNNDGSATVTYRDIASNSGNGAAYDLVLNDPGAGTGLVTYSGPGPLNNVTSVGASGGHFAATVSTLAPGHTESFVFSVNIPAGDVVTAVTHGADPATLTSYSLAPVYEVAGQETLAGTSRTPAQASTTASAGLDLVTGTVNQDVGAASGAGTPLIGLDGQTVSVTFAGQTTPESLMTASDGTYAILVPDMGVPVTLTVTVTSPTPDTLDNASEVAGSIPGSTLAGSNPASLTFTPGPNVVYAPVTFDFWRPLDSAPVLAHGPGAPLSEQDGSAVVPFAQATVADAQLDRSFAHDFSGTTLTVQRYVANTAAPDAGDVFSAAGSPSSGVVLSNGPGGSGNVLLDGTMVGGYTEGGGRLTILFFGAGNVTTTEVNAVLNGITYQSGIAVSTLVPGVVIGARIDDANNDPVALNGNGLDPYGPHDQGPGGDMLSNVLTATIDVSRGAPPAVFVEPNDANPRAAAVAVVPAIDLGDIVATDGRPSRVTFTLIGGHPEDVLSFTDTGDIIGNFSNGTMTLTTVSGHTPSVADWQAAVRSVRYHDTNDRPDTSTRAIEVSVTSGGNVATLQVGVAVVAVNDSPVLDGGMPLSLDPAHENQGSDPLTPHGAVGTLVAQLAGRPESPGIHDGSPGSLAGNVTDPDSAGLTNGASLTVPGIAIIGSNNNDGAGQPIGTWFYSIDNGATWTVFPATISPTHPLDLAATARIAFQPAVTDFNGQIPGAITYRAWDGFDGVANGAQADLTGVTVFGQAAGDNTAATAYSDTTIALPLMVDNVNNAPTVSGLPGSVSHLPPISTSDQHPRGQTVADLVAHGFNDGQDGQFQPVVNTQGSVPNGLAGIAITGNAATPGQGTWDYSVDGGATWTPIPTDVSQAHAIVLPTDARIAFVPADGFTGHPGPLSVNLIDASPSLVAPGLTGEQLAQEGSGGAPSAAATDVFIPVVGGSTAFSATPVILDIVVAPVPAVPVFSHTPFALAGFGPPGFPGNLRLEPTGMQFWATDDFLSRPLIPELSLIGSIANRFIIVEQHAIITVPSNIFVSNLPQSQLSYEATLSDGSSLPPWLTFNANDLTFVGTPPRSAHGRLEIQIRVRDTAGHTADATFNILIGRDTEDLVALLRPGWHPRLYLPGHASDAGRGLQQATIAFTRAADRLAQQKPVESPAHAPVPAASQIADLPPLGPQPGGFSAALHEAGPMSAMGRARALLDSLDELDRP